MSRNSIRTSDLSNKRKRNVILRTGSMVLVTRSQGLDAAWTGVHARLVRRIVRSIPPAIKTILEVGSGRGQVTVPLADALPDVAITAVDQFQGPYSRDRAKLLAGLKRTGAAHRVRIITANALPWISRQRAGRFDVVLSSEFLPDIDSDLMRRFFRGCHRVLRPGGTTVHLFLSPDPSGPRQQLVVEADSDPRWTTHSPREWFSPPPALVVRALAAAGFGRLRTRYYPGGLVVRGEAARSLLRKWGVRPVFVKSYADRLSKEGLELPDWVVTWGTKPE
jgi:SAM-dependent methyltransferase